MSSNTKWEVVSKKTGKKKTQPKSQEKTFNEALPSHMSEEATIYSNLLEKTRKDVPKQNPEETKKPAAKNNKSNQNTKKKYDKKAVKISLTEACKQLVVADFEDMLKSDKETFPNNPSLWLNDFASLLNLKLDNVSDSESAFNLKKDGGAASLIPSKLRSLLVNVMTKNSAPTMENFLNHCLQSIATEANKGLTVHGHRIMVQLLLKHKPQVVTKNSQTYVDMVEKYRDRPSSCLTILRALGQAGLSDINSGLKVWKDLYFPMITSKHLSTHVVEYIENILSLHKESFSQHSDALTCRDFFPFLDEVFTQQSTHPIHLQKRLHKLYPSIKKLAFGEHRVSNMHEFFSLFLRRCSSANSLVKQECLQCLVECLSKDRESFNTWRKVYTSQMPASGELLQHLVREWSTVRGSLDVRQLRSTVTSFTATNQQLSANTAGLQTCQQACQELLSMHRPSLFPWRWTLLALVFVIVAIVVADAVTSKGFKNSKTKHLLDDCGVTSFMLHLWSNIQLYITIALKWLKKNVPVYYRHYCALLRPYLQLFWEKLYDAAVYIIDLMQPLIIWAQTTAPLVLAWVERQLPWLWSGTVHIAGVVIKVVMTYLVTAWHYVIYALNALGQWLLLNVFVDSWSPLNLSRLASFYLTQFLQCLHTALQWCSDLLNQTDSS